MLALDVPKFLIVILGDYERKDCSGCVQISAERTQSSGWRCVYC